MFKASAIARLPAAAFSRVRIDAYSRLVLDINAAHNADQVGPSEPLAPVEKSAAALRGETLRGDVRLPYELQEAVTAVLERPSPPTSCFS